MIDLEPIKDRLRAADIPALVAEIERLRAEKQSNVTGVPVTFRRTSSSAMHACLNHVPSRVR